MMTTVEPPLNIGLGKVYHLIHNEFDGAQK